MLQGRAREASRERTQYLLVSGMKEAVMTRSVRPSDWVWAPRAFAEHPGTRGGAGGLLVPRRGGAGGSGSAARACGQPETSRLGDNFTQRSYSLSSPYCYCLVASRPTVSPDSSFVLTRPDPRSPRA